MTHIVALTHIECEGPGWWGEFLDERSATVDRVRLAEGEALPDLAAYDAVLVLGGPMNVDEDAKHPWLTGEKAAIRASVDAGQPVIGMCLGAQLIARAMGATVKPNPVKEIGFSAVTLTDDGRSDALFAGCPSLLPVFQWHGDTFDLPDHAALLATSTLCANQAFRVGSNAYGLQFHVETTPDNIAEWVTEYRREAERELPPGAGPRMIAQAHAAADSVKAQSRQIFENLMDALGIG